MEAEHVLSTPLGRIKISSAAIAHIVGETAAECYGVVAMAGRKWLPARAALATQRPVSILINNKAEGCSPLTIRALAEMLAEEPPLSS